MSSEQYTAAETAFRTDKVMTDDKATLIQHLMGLSNQDNHNPGTQHRDTIRGITINHLLLQKHIDELERKNKLIQWLVIVLTLASLFGTIWDHTMR